MSTQVLSPPSETTTVAGTDGREAIIFIPGIGRAWDDPVIEGVARRMAIAIDRQSNTAKATTRVETAEQAYGEGDKKCKCKVFTIVKKNGQEERPLIDVFGLDFNDTLVESDTNRNLVTKIIMLAVTMIDSFRRLIFRFYKRSKSWKEKIQLMYGLLTSGLFVAYFVLLLFAAIAAVGQLKSSFLAQSNVPPAPAQQNSPAQNALVLQQSQPGVFESLGSDIENVFRSGWGAVKSLYARTKNVSTAVVVLLTAVGFALPPQAKLKENISLAATNYLCLIHYLNWGERRNEIGGKLESLLEVVVEREPNYNRIHIVGYSFGSIVAIDNLFTVGRKPIERFKRIDTLVTIGCPFDIIRTYWPDYFLERQSVSADAPKWLNIYSPIDILSSNFADGGNEQPLQQTRNENVGVQVDGHTRKPESVVFSQANYQSLGMIDILTLTGFKAHTLYWGETVKGEITCFHDMVREMYQGTPVLD